MKNDYDEKNISFPPKQLAKKFKHARNFGIHEKYNSGSAIKFRSAIENHISDSKTKAIEGTYRKTIPVTHFVNPETGLNVMVDSSGQFLSGWKLSKKQLENVLTKGQL